MRKTSPSSALVCPCAVWCLLGSSHQCLAVLAVWRLQDHRVNRMARRPPTSWAAIRDPLHPTRAGSLIQVLLRPLHEDEVLPSITTTQAKSLFYMTYQKHTGAISNGMAPFERQPSIRSHMNATHIGNLDVRLYGFCFFLISDHKFRCLCFTGGYTKGKREGGLERYSCQIQKFPKEIS